MHKVLAFAAALLVSHVALATASGEPPVPAARTLQEVRACVGLNSDVSTKKALIHEMAAHFGEPMPAELEGRLNKHFERVLALKAECQQRS